MNKLHLQRLQQTGKAFKKHSFKISAFVLSMAISCLAFANPEGGQVVSGTATISSTGNTQTITQTTDKAIINWQSFNINANETNHFQQPLNGIALNRINPAQGVSQIWGRLSATGTIILVNQAGIFFGPNARVDVGGIIASTADISNENFLNGNYKFDQASPYAGSIVNQGAITAAEHGLVALLGTAVRNDGRIQADLGNVILASGAKFTVSFSGDDLINFTIDEETNKAGLDRHGKTLRDGVSNTGAVYANGGTILMTAKVAQHVVRNVINMKGIAEAKSVAQRNGRIFFLGDDEGTVKISGRVIASGDGANQRGGVVKVLGKHVRIGSRAHIDASGDAGGGEILLGGNKQGMGSDVHAQDLFVSKDATFLADAFTQGDGGKIIFWSDNNTQVLGTVSAKGGALAGNGGFVETSGHYLIAPITPNLTAPHGTTGMWLIDPSDLTISAAATTNTSFNSNTYTANQPDMTTVPNLNVTDLETALATANITVLTTVNGTGGNGDILVNAPITWASNNTLMLNAYRNIILNDTISNTNGASSANVVLRSDNTGIGVGTICGAGSNGCGGSPGGLVSLAGTGTVTAYYNPVSFGTQDTLYTGGTTPITYMLVNNAADLNSINNFSLASGQNYALGHDIDLSGIANFTPIGNQITGPFFGNFDGQGYTISNLTITDATANNSIGLFGFTSGSTLANFTLSNTSITESGDNTKVGGFVGNAASTSLNNIHLTGAVNVTWDGLNAINIQNTGGLAGYADSSSTITNSTSAAAVTSNLGSVTDSGNIGGLIGQNDGTITNSSASGAVSLTIATHNSGNYTLGGLVGANNGSITNSSVAGGSVSLTSSFDSTTGGSENVGGIIGANYNSNTIPSLTAINSSNSVMVNGDNVGGTRHIGGLIGYNQGSIAGTSSSSGDIIVTGLLSNNASSGSSENIGGLIGNNNFFNANTLANVSSSSNLTVNMDILNVNVSSGLPGSYANIGGLIGSSTNVLLDGASSSGTILITSDITSQQDGGNASTNVGGLIGGNYVNSGTASLIQNATRTGALTYNQSHNGITAAYLTIGGLIGDNQSNISLASVSGSISVINNLTPGGTSGSGESIGGLAGNSGSGITIQSTTSTNPITVVTSINGGQSNIQIGGLVANNNSTILGTPSVITRSGDISLTSDIAQNSSASMGGLVSGNNYSSNGSGILQDVTSSSALTFQQASTSIAGGVTIGGAVAGNQNSILRTSSSGAITVTADFLNTANLTVGGLVGYNGNNGTNVGTLQDSTSASVLTIGQVSTGYAGYFGIGGLVGSNQAFIDGSDITGASSTGAITINVNIVGGGGSVGGLVGSNNYYNDGSFISAGTIQNISSSTDVTITEAAVGLGGYVGGIQVGGLVGQNNSLINNTRGSGAVSLTADFNPGGYASVGGLVGSNSYYQDNSGVPQAVGTIQNSISSGAVNIEQVATGITQGGLNIGGFAGQNQYLISDSSSSGAVRTRVNVDQGGISVGGLMGSFNTPTDNMGTPLTQAIVSRSTTSSAVTVEGPGSTVNAPIQMINASGNVGVGGIIGSSSAVFDATGVVGASTSGPIYVAISTLDSAMTGNPIITFVGGLIGQLGGGSVLGNPLSSSSLTANLTNNSGLVFVGGLIGLNNGGTTIGSVPPTVPVLPGLTSSAPVNVTIDNSNNGIVGVGGLIGVNIGNIGQSFNTGAVNVNVLNNTTGGLIVVGGLMGSIINPFNPPPLPLLTNSYNMGAVSVTVQNNSSQILTGGISGSNGFSNSPLGPLPGGTISNTYNAGAVNVQVINNTGQVTTSGVIGDIAAGAVVTDSFWDTQTSGQSSGVGSGTGTNIVGGCLGGGSCPGGGTANLSAAATYTNAGWDFTNTWGIIEGVSYPYLKPFVSSNPRVISGTATAGTTVGLAVNGLAVTTQATPNGFFYFFVPNLTDGTPILTYLPGTGGNLATLTPNGGVSITGITFTPNTLVIGDLHNYILSNTLLSTAIGDLTNNGMLYSASGANLVLGNASTPSLNFRPTATTTYALDGNISSYLNTVTQIVFPTTQLTADASVAGTTIQFNGPVSGAFNLTATATNQIILPSSINTSTGNQNYNGAVTLGNNTVLTGNNIQFANNITGNNTTFTLATTGSNSVITGTLDNISSLIKNGAGILQLAGANTYTGTTLVNAGTVRAQSANVFSANSAITLSNGAALDLNSFNNTIGGLTGSGNVALGIGTLTINTSSTSTNYDGVIQGGGNLIKTGPGALTLTQANLFTGATTINDGVLALAISNALATSSGVTVNAGGTMQLNNITINTPNVVLNGGQLLAVGTVGINGNVSVTGNSAISTNASSDSITLSGQINGPAGLTLQGPGAIVISVSSGTITPLANLNSTAGNTILNNGGITTVGNQQYSGAVTLGMDSVFTSQISGAISFNSLNAANHTLTLNAGVVTLGGALQGLNTVTVNGTGGNNSLIVNTGDLQQWFITGTNRGNLTQIAGVSGLFSFTNIQNLTGGSNSNTYTFNEGALVSGTITGGSSLNNTLNYAAYTTPLSVILGLDGSGLTRNGDGIIITRFADINTIIANGISSLTFPNIKNFITVTGFGQGFASTPIHFMGFNTLIGQSGEDRVMFDTTGYSINSSKNIVIFNNAQQMQFINISLNLLTPAEREAAISTTLINQGPKINLGTMLTDIHWFDEIDANIYQMDDQFWMNTTTNRICVLNAYGRRVCS